MKECPRKVMLAAISLTIAALALIPASCNGGGAVGYESPSGIKNPYGLYSPGNLDELSTADAQAMIKALGVGTYAAFQNYNLRLAEQIGIGWTRYDIWYNGSSFEEPSTFLNQLRGVGIEVVGCIRPVNGFRPAEDLSGFQVQLEQLVQRHPDIKVWQIGNEPNLSFANPDDYPRFFVAGSQAVRKACPGCRVMLAGVAARYPAENVAQGEYDRMVTQIVRLSGGGRPFDIFDVHYYGPAYTEDELLAEIMDYRRILSDNGFTGNDVEMWLTETATYTGTPTFPPGEPPQTEAQQAGELVRRFVTALGAGLARVSWSRMYENCGYDGKVGGFYDNLGLIYNGMGQEAGRGIKAGTRKESWYAYRTLVTKTRGYDEIRFLAPGVYEFDFGIGGHGPVYVAWDAGAGADASRLLPAGARGPVTVTDIMGKETRTSAASLKVGSSPVFIEPV